MIIKQQELIVMDGSHGEGGGQILRTALALSAILKKPFSIHHIRSKRKKPGLQAQHLEAVEALARITGAQTEGVKLGSQKIVFFPQRILPGDYRFEVRTAGSVILLLQAILLPLCLSGGSSNLILIGGTHVPWSPSFHYLSEVLMPTLRRMGVSAEAAMEQWGFYPRGGGKIRLKISPVHELKPICLANRGPLQKISGISASSHLPRHVAERQRKQALNRILKELGVDAQIAIQPDVSSSGPGSFLFLLAEYKTIPVGFSSLGFRGKPAEKVADEAVDSLRDFMKSDGCIDPHLADQLIPFMAIAKGASFFTTTKMTEHLLTNIWVIKQFLKVKIDIEGEKGMPGRLVLFPMAEHPAI